MGKKSRKPTNPTVLALADSAVQVRDGSLLEDSMARPKSMSDNCKPMASDVPPLTPTNTLRCEPPMVSALTSTTSAVLPGLAASLTLVSRDSTAKSPSTWTKPNKSIFR